MRISDWSSDVCSSDLLESLEICPITSAVRDAAFRITVEPDNANGLRVLSQVMVDKLSTLPRSKISKPFGRLDDERMKAVDRSEEHTSELQSLMRISYAVFCLKTKIPNTTTPHT